MLDSLWSILSLSESAVDALTADNPVVYLGDVKLGFSFMVPISPRKAFVVASHSDDAAKVAELKRSGLTKMINRHLVKHASRYVYSTGPQHEVLVKKYLRREQTVSGA